MIATISISITSNIIQCTSMKPLRATYATIIINSCPWHFAHITNVIVESTSILVHVIATNSLVCKETTVLSNRKQFMLQEIIQFGLTLHTRIFHKIIQKIYEGLERKSLLHKLQNTLTNTTMNFFTLVKNLAVLDFDHTLTKILYSLFKIDQLCQFIIRSSWKSLQNQTIINMIWKNLMSLVIKDHRQITINPHKRNTHNKLLFSCEIKTHYLQYSSAFQCCHR